MAKPGYRCGWRFVVPALFAVGCVTVQTPSGGPPPAPPPEAPTPSPARLSDDPEEIDREGLARFVRAQSHEIKACYDAELRQRPSTRGKLVLRFSVGPAGNAVDLAIDEDTFFFREMAMCVMHRVRQWAFPFRPRAPVPVVYPFIFAPADDAPR